MGRSDRESKRGAPSHLAHHRDTSLPSRCFCERNGKSSTGQLPQLVTRRYEWISLAKAGTWRRPGMLSTVPKCPVAPRNQLSRGAQLGLATTQSPVKFGVMMLLPAQQPIHPLLSTQTTFLLLSSPSPSTQPPGGTPRSAFCIIFFFFSALLQRALPPASSEHLTCSILRAKLPSTLPHLWTRDRRFAPTISRYPTSRVSMD